MRHNLLHRWLCLLLIVLTTTACNGGAVTAIVARPAASAVPGGLPATTPSGSPSQDVASATYGISGPMEAGKLLVLRIGGLAVAGQANSTVIVIYTLQTGDSAEKAAQALAEAINRAAAGGPLPAGIQLLASIAGISEAQIRAALQGFSAVASGSTVVISRTGSATGLTLGSQTTGPLVSLNGQAPTASFQDALFGGSVPAGSLIPGTGSPGTGTPGGSAPPFLNGPGTPGASASPGSGTPDPGTGGTGSPAPGATPTPSPTPFTPVIPFSPPPVIGTPGPTPGPNTPITINIILFSPQEGGPGTVVTITATGHQTADPAQLTVTFNGTAGTVRSINGATITALVPENATTGPIIVRDQVGSSQPSVPDFVVRPVTLPTISSVVPTMANPGQEIVINGDNFDTVAANILLNFGGDASTNPVSATSTQLRVVVPQGAKTGTISILNTFWGYRSEYPVFVVGPPTILAFSPTSGGPNTVVTITGSNFDPNTLSNNKVFFLAGDGGAVGEGTPASLLAVAGTTSLTVLVPNPVQSGVIQLVTPLGHAETATQFVVLDGPVIGSFSPTTGPVGTVVTILGSGFDSDPANTQVFFGNFPATPTQASANQLKVAVPQGASSAPLVVVSGGRIALSSTTFITGNPTITALSPTSGKASDALVIVGNNFDANTAANNVVELNSVSLTVASVTANLLTVTLPQGVTTGTVKVTTPLGSVTSSQTYTVGPPEPVDFSPRTAVPGDTVEVIGANFDAATPGNNFVTVNGAVGTTLTVGPNSITFRVPDNATTGPIRVAHLGGASDPSPFNLEVQPLPSPSP